MSLVVSYFNIHLTLSGHSLRQDNWSSCTCNSNGAWVDWETWAWPLKQDAVQSGPLEWVCVWKTQRRSSVLGVADLTHTCMWVVQREAALVTQPCMVIGQVRHTESNLDWYAVSFQCHLCVCYSGICTSSITDTCGLSVLKGKSQCKPHLVCEQSGTQTQHIFSLCGQDLLKICYQCNCCN